MAQVVFGHDMDFSISRTAEHLEDANFEGAAGRRRGQSSIPGSCGDAGCNIIYIYTNI